MHWCSACTGQTCHSSYSVKAYSTEQRTSNDSYYEAADRIAAPRLAEETHRNVLLTSEHSLPAGLMTAVEDEAKAMDDART